MMPLALGVLLRAHVDRPRRRDGADLRTGEVGRRYHAPSSVQKDITRAFARRASTVA